MSFRISIISGSAMVAMLALPAFAQSIPTNVVREAVPAKAKPIIANSPEDLALQAEIKKIKAYNEYVNSQVGVETQSTPIETAPQAIEKIELFAPEKPAIVVPAARTTAPITKIIERQPSTGSTSIYRVAQGDTLYNLSKRHCVTVETIQNQNDLSSSNIQLGQVLTMPANQCGVAEAESAVAKNEPIGFIKPEPAISKTVISNSYAVLPKDSLYSIGRQYCITAGELAVANGITTATTIQPGQILQLPQKACKK